MKTRIFIIIGILVLLLAVSAWIFLYVVHENNAPGGDIFTNFGITGDRTPESTTTGNTASTTIDTTGPSVEGGVPEALKQLTTRPVAGAAFVGNTIRYVERGTGHMYEIDLKNEKENQISGTTVPRTVRAVFGQNGIGVSLESETGETNEIVAGTIGATSSAGFDGVTLPPGAREIGWSTDGKSVYYLLDTEAGAAGYAYTLATKKSATLFEIPLRDVRVLWGTPQYVYTIPSGKAEGYIYRIGKTGLEPMTAGAPGLMATRAGSVLMMTSVQEGSLMSALVGGRTVFPLTAFLSDKCAGISETAVYCGAPLNYPEGFTYPDDWYKGLVSTADVLFRVNVASSSVQVMSDLSAASGRTIDMGTIGTNADGSLIYFINKIDGALWMFDTTVK